MRRAGEAGGLGAAGGRVSDPRSRSLDGLLGQELPGEPAAVQIGDEAAASNPVLLTHHLRELPDRLGAARLARQPQPVEELQAVGDQDSPG